MPAIPPTVAARGLSCERLPRHLWRLHLNVIVVLDASSFRQLLLFSLTGGLLQQFKHSLLLSCANAGLTSIVRGSRCLSYIFKAKSESTSPTFIRSGRAGVLLVRYLRRLTHHALIDLLHLIQESCLLK